MLKTRKNSKSGIRLLLAFILICSTLIFMLGVPVLAAENDTPDADQTESGADGSGDNGETTPDDGETNPDDGEADGGENNDSNEGDTGSGDGTSDEDSTETDTSEEETSAFKKWWDSYNQIIGYIVAGLILVAIIITIALWIPKDEKKTKTKKNR